MTALQCALPLLALLPVAALAHSDLSWPAQFKSASGIPCCTLNAVMGECVRVSHEPEPVVCLTGCAFSPAGV